ncbi:aldo/keto reductase [Corallococcus sp. BB11-1]|uniref:aldo/keto reductase n=1 Tax=Corallococcus sp. BB11-1 TaxID=2996783 RepID=UPI0010DC5BC1|nr:aldo/keto reductase [Corallococcus sp. BB11-1]MCY1032922.1 aldo/keto reductase [Corallococcus sp. BB11-1]RYZ45952.1 MAG: aldo/keto reductase [Myxococcaceae bacterium]
MSMDRYYLLGRSGLRVSPLSLGTMTFGKDGPYGGAWGSTDATSRALFDRYLEAGGNFIDTADYYTAGTSETLLGKFMEERGVRDRVVLASKYSYNSTTPGDPNAGGNGRKNMMRAVEASLRRLRTDYIDLYLLHTWDRITPAEEVVRTFDDLVRAGKIRYAGLSDVPAWYAARAQTWAEAHALTPIINLQLQYSLVERSLEPEFAPLAQTLGMGITAWSPLGMGLLSGRYKPSEGRPQGEGRLTSAVGGEHLGLFNERNWGVVATLEKVAKELGRDMSQVALNWVATQPGVGSVIIGASSLTQLDGNLAALDFTIPAGLRQQLEEVSAPAVPFPHGMFSNPYQLNMHGNAAVGDKPAGYTSPVFTGLAPTVG